MIQDFGPMLVWWISVPEAEESAPPPPSRRITDGPVWTGVVQYRTEPFLSDSDDANRATAHSERWLPSVRDWGERKRRLWYERMIRDAFLSPSEAEAMCAEFTDGEYASKRYERQLLLADMTVEFDGYFDEIRGFLE